jgi:hypothetical protein
LSAYLDVPLWVNPQTFLEVWKMANGAAMFEEVFTEAGIIPQWIKQGIEQGKKEKALAIARNLLAKGWGIPVDTGEARKGLYKALYNIEY